MAVRNDWIVADSTARNAISVTDGDVRSGDECRLMDSGKVYRAIASGSGASCWSQVAPFLASASAWTSTPTAVTNMDAVTFSSGIYAEFGDFVIGFATFSADPTAAAAASFRFSLPVNSSFSATTQALGIATGTNVTGGRCSADTANDQIKVDYTAGGTSAVTMTVVFGYVRLP